MFEIIEKSSVIQGAGMSPHRVVLTRRKNPVMDDKVFTTHIQVFPNWPDEQGAHFVAGHYDLDADQADRDFYLRTSYYGLEKE